MGGRAFGGRRGHGREDGRDGVRGLRQPARAAGVLATVALLGVAVAGCGGDKGATVMTASASGSTSSEGPSHTGTPTPARTQAVVGGPVPLRVVVPAGGDLEVSTGTPAPPTEGCPGFSARLDVNEDAWMSLESWGVHCEFSHEAPGNGRHGHYRTVADLPAGAPRQTVSTALGDAMVFDQEYYECTNSCRRWTESVALVTLRHPSSADHPTLLVRADRGAVSRQDLVEFLRTGLLTGSGAGSGTGSGAGPTAAASAATSPAASVR